MDKTITVEIAYALETKQILLRTEVPVGSSITDVLKISGIQKQCPELDLTTCPVGIFSKHVSNPDTFIVENEDRIEIYRPLIADPKEVRRLRALKVNAKK